LHLSHGFHNPLKHFYSAKGRFSRDENRLIEALGRIAGREE
jgi:hypothetical protein